MTKSPTPTLVTFTKWCVNRADRTPVTINPSEITSVEDYCGNVSPGSMITLKSKKTYLVFGVHAEIVAKLRGEA